jgi:hypothetical protein
MAAGAGRGWWVGWWVGSEGVCGGRERGRGAGAEEQAAGEWKGGMAVQRMDSDNGTVKGRRRCMRLRHGKCGGPKPNFQTHTALGMAGGRALPSTIDKQDDARCYGEGPALAPSRG